MNKSMGKIFCGGYEECVPINLDTHIELCDELRRLTSNLFAVCKKGNSALYHAIDSFEREPELIVRIEELEKELRTVKGDLPIVRLSGKQRDVYKYIVEFLEVKNHSPSVREISAKLGHKSSSTAHGYLERLKDKGVIQWDPTHPRTIRIIAHCI